MDELIRYITSHQLTVAIAVCCAFFITWFLFKKLFKMALLVLLIFLGIYGYFYWKNPETAKQNIQSTLKTAEQKTIESVEKGITGYKMGKEYIEKGKQKIEEVDKIWHPEPGKGTKP
ncbi:MAG: hypothetical protein GX147_02605 [Deltaproteobacteria bacterium]|jgi:glucan phosphoethanolaminetransferase (alkaline phosphatase superfamily)|nr:hypothetical protein [Deltaproteobacteria bacterium]